MCMAAVTSNCDSVWCDHLCHVTPWLSRGTGHWEHCCSGDMRSRVSVPSLHRHWDNSDILHAMLQLFGGMLNYHYQFNIKCISFKDVRIKRWWSNEYISQGDAGTIGHMSCLHINAEHCCQGSHNARGVTLRVTECYYTVLQSVTECHSHTADTRTQHRAPRLAQSLSRCFMFKFIVSAGCSELIREIQLYSVSGEAMSNALTREMRAGDSH